jgi:hypothetical protein
VLEGREVRSCLTLHLEEEGVGLEQVVRWEEVLD